MTGTELEASVRERLAAGDADGAATEALRALGPPVLRYLRSTLRREELAADAFSDFAERFWRGLPGFAWRASLRTWAFGLAHHVAIDVTSGAWGRRARRFETGEASRLAVEIRTRTAVRVERQRQALDELRAELTVDERELLALRVDQALSWSEIAEIVSREGEPASAATLTKRFERLREKLARRAKEKGLLEG